MPAVTSSSGRPSGTPAPGRSEGATRRNRSSQMPPRTMPAMEARAAGRILTARLRSRTNGTAKTEAKTVQVTGAQAPCIRCWMNRISSGRSAYQITRYCDQSM